MLTELVKDIICNNGASQSQLCSTNGITLNDGSQSSVTAECNDGSANDSANDSTNDSESDSSDTNPNDSSDDSDDSSNDSGDHDDSGI